MNKLSIRLAIVVLVLFSGFYVSVFNSRVIDGLAFIGGIGNVAIKPIVLNQEDISNITKPAIVSIYHHIKGTVIIPYFDIDWKTLEIAFPGTKKPISLPVDKYIRGSGFIISQDGYVVTNAHVASDAYYKRAVAQQLIALKFVSAIRTASSLAQLDSTLKKRGIDIVDATQFGEELAFALGERLAGKMNLTATSTITTLNPSSTGSKLSDLIDKGFPAKIIDVNNDPLKDQKDVAILKINETDLPTIGLNASQVINVGNTIYVYGFPSTGQFSPKDVLEATFTKGTVSGFKDSTTNSFKVVQTDAKVSLGSSGGPLLDDKGEAIGILTFATEAKTAGDAFAFAIPISLVKNILENKGVSVNKSVITQSLQDGILYTQNNRCQKAIKSFEVAKTINKNFSITKNIQPYLDSCAAIISSGRSIDNSFDEFKVWASNLGGWSWALASLAVIVVAITIFVILRLLRRVRKDEMQISRLEDNSVTTQSMLSHQSKTVMTQTQTSPTENINPQILNYITSTRQSGFGDEAIINELKKAGWPEDAIQRAIQKSTAKPV